MAIKLLHGKTKIWPEITSLVKKGQKNRVAVAFMSKGAKKLLPLHPGDTLVIDMSRERVKTGATNPFAVREFFEDGVLVFSCRGLHAKVFVLGNRAVVGSTNVSSLANLVLDEAALSTNEKSIVKAAGKFIEQLVDQEGTLPVTELMLKKLEKEFSETGWHGGGGSADEDKESWSLAMMKKIAPKSVVTSRGSPHLEPTGWKAIRRIYLRDSDGTVVLELYPGDTTEQAVPFHEKLDANRLVKLISRGDGWGAQPNFHLGYRSRGFLHTDTTKKLLNYLMFWKKPPDDLPIAAVKKKEYAKLAARLKKYGMFHPSDFADLTETIKNRPWVSVRPGVKLTFTWDAKEPTAKEVVTKINEALGTWGESVASGGTGKGKTLNMRSVSA